MPTVHEILVGSDAKNQILWDVDLHTYFHTPITAFTLTVPINDGPGYSNTSGGGFGLSPSC